MKVKFKILAIAISTLLIASTSFAQSPISSPVVTVNQGRTSTTVNVAHPTVVPSVWGDTSMVSPVKFARA